MGLREVKRLAKVGRVTSCHGLPGPKVPYCGQSLSPREPEMVGQARKSYN